MPRDSSSTIAPRTLGRYDLLLEIASGGMATVYLARARGDAGFERIVALKLCHPHLRKDPAFATMFVEEARLAARIRHPNVATTFDVVDDDEALALVMEYVEGTTLWGLLRDGTGMPRAIALRVLLDALAGLHAAHELHDLDDRPSNVVHRDVSPHNVLVGIDGAARIADFGIAKAEARLSFTAEGEIRGKLGYMPPEQVLSQPLTRSADVFAAGVVAWEALTGRRLFTGETRASVANQVLRADIAPPSTLVPDVPPALDAAVLRALARDPDVRFATCAAFADAIEQTTAPVASTRAVGEYVRRVCADELAARRAQLRAAMTDGSTMPASSGATPAVLDATAYTATVPVDRARTRLAASVVAAASGIVLVALVTVHPWTHASPDRAPARAPRVDPPVAPAHPAPVPSPPAPAPAAPAPPVASPSSSPHASEPRRAGRHTAHPHGTARARAFFPTEP